MNGKPGALGRWCYFSLAAVCFLLCVPGCRESRINEPAVPVRRTLFDAADSLYRNGNYEEAARQYAALREQFEMTGDQANLWRARLWQVRTLHVLGRNKDLADEFEPLMQMAKGHPGREGWTRCTFGLLSARGAQYEQAIAEGRRGLEMARVTGDGSLAGVCYDTIVTALSNSGRARESLVVSEERLTAERARGAPPRELADALNDIGVDYRHVGRFEDAIRVYEEALGLYRRLGEPEGQAKVLYNLANIHEALGDIDRCILLKVESLQLAEKIGHAWGLGSLHADLGGIFLERGMYAEARSHLTRAMTIAHSAELPYVEADALLNLGRLETRTGQHEKARQTFREGIAIADARQVRGAAVKLRAAAARNDAADDRSVEGTVTAMEAVRLAASLNDPEIEFLALEARAITLETAKDPGAVDAYLAAIDLLESVRGRLALGDLRMGIADRRLGVYEGAIRVLLSQDRAAEGFDVAERARARVLLALMAEQQSRSSASEEEMLRQRLREAFVARRSVRDEKRRNALDLEIARLTSELDQNEARAHAEESATGGLRNPLPASLGEIRNSLVDQDSGLLSFFWGDGDVFGWWIDQKEIRAARLGDSDALTPAVDLLRTAIEHSGRSGEWQVPARSSWARFIAPLSPSAKRRVVVIPDGPLSYVPFETFIARGTRLPWGAETEFTYGPSASVMVALARRQGRGDFSRAVLAVGDPVSGPVLASLFGGSPKAGREPLPHAAREVRWISRMFRDGGSDHLIGSDATLAEWMKYGPQNYRYLHFATHAHIDDREPNSTSLAMADGGLDVMKIRQLSLRTELVTLSACETALGPRIRGEGIIGLPHAFLSAGARGVMVTLWRVPDESTAEFVRQFYQEIHDGAAPSRALLSVRRRWIDTRPPQEWAPFILIGGLPTPS